jgi:hypothetical protein
MRLVSRVSGMLATMIVAAHSETSSPIWAVETSKSRLIAGSRPAGIISTVTVAKTAIASVSSVFRDRLPAVTVAGRTVVSLMARR